MNKELFQDAVDKHIDQMQVACSELELVNKDVQSGVISVHIGNIRRRNIIVGLKEAWSY